ncbi:MAG: hypothetical protein CMJ78_26110 [Planctomycetaceae bacterium]|nr:hypothetical protein [Planctomycetaceae bacterium]
MPELTPQLIVFLIGVGLFTLTAAISDLRTRRIPNKLNVPVLFAGLIYQGAFNGWAGLQDAGLAFLAGFGILFLLWMVGGGGGGDVKLMGALSVWLGFTLTLYVLVARTICVLLGTSIVIVWSIVFRGMRGTNDKYTFDKKLVEGRQKVKETMEARQKRRIMAYAIPVAIATWLTVIWKINDFPFINVEKPEQAATTDIEEPAT